MNVFTRRMMNSRIVSGRTACIRTACIQASVLLTSLMAVSLPLQAQTQVQPLQQKTHQSCIKAESNNVERSTQVAPFDVLLDFVLPVSSNTERNVDLYAMTVPEPIANWYVVDVSQGSTILPQTFKMALRSLKHKSYLHDKPILLLGNGINYHDLEIEVAQLNERLRFPVKIFLGGVPAWQETHRDRTQEHEHAQSTYSIPTILPAQFVVESELGSWGYIYTEKQLAALFSQADYTFNMDRYLLMDSRLVKILQARKDGVPENLKASLFVLDGGLSALEKYAVHQSRILSRIQKQESEQPCQ
ncbi:hypothetical protein ACFFLZ_14645 [Photobacterium aphoticum]|uniref:Rhodanese domain-containing protein n=1 Tax=Photobacterium aphoticum TaxID=754436 RepID=A0A0J1GLF3_9GAMM|nr:hypothetical protein [Photobacterium aphoticum]KLV00538.1 hypothetical protein ABT58_12900 [Photobacterium aphoticum]PSU59894.1 hypothetical protein C9I90_02740 [Photobacterium aphoticum]GHA41497.1 hypothetical protein GCM10007086_13720 [Photobacterium aphoticum]